jgi:UTP---glucose-1-phosphate uridylyltransferase
VTKEPLPAARLLFCGRSLFEGLMRDVEAQEYWHYRAFGEQVVVPVLIMTSQEKNNDHHIEAMGIETNWFGRPQMLFGGWCNLLSL